jgi:hypothetical protein
MTLKGIFCLLSCTVSFNLMAQQSFYCPQNHGYINLGMTLDQVIAACGQPLRQHESEQPVYEKIPVQQFIYNNQGTSTAFYGVWNIPTGSGGVPLQVDVLNQKVQAIKLNGSDNNAFSVCGGRAIQVGDPVVKLYRACGNPDVINNTFTQIPIQSSQKPLIWTYQSGTYQTPFTLTFINGKLQSINN